MLERFYKWALDLDHPEGVATSLEGKVFAGGEAGQLYHVSSEGNAEEVANTGGFVLGLALDADDRVYICDAGNKALMRWDPRTDELVTLCVNVNERSLVAPNYPAFGPDGALYFTDSGTARENDGVIYMLTEHGQVRVCTEESAWYPNGCAVAPAGDYLYVVESYFPAVVRYTIGRDGRIGSREIVAQLPGTLPDGLCFGQSGNLYVSCYRPDRIYAVTPDQRVIQIADDPIGSVLNTPTNLTFAGPDRDRIVVASLGGRHLALGDIGDVGAGPFHPKVAY